MTNDIWFGLAHHVLTLAGGVFVSKGYVDADAANVAIGALTSLAGVAWSVIDKKRR